MHVLGSEPYPWPYDGADVASWAVLAIASAGSAGGGLAGRAAARVAAAARGAGCPVVHVDVGTAPAGPPRAGAVPDGPPPVVEPGDVTVAAPGWNGFDGSPLDAVLRRLGRTTLLVTGRWLETGVHSTLRAANDRGYECATVADACEPWDAALAPAALSSIRFSGGIFGAVVATGPVVAALGGVPHS
ncbi:isochorismatase family protein [Cellulomonas alba]|uniref:Isochorismatase family protein n=1 Tax=Cellulomonas alba TaxID=3053467 RepID=A0ABT7SCK1_9CELL|nr:isochorismatase family protein [Cellulomonas alba]MDM7853916.1 isochorismatase family protein [Cellulomonas alba]